MADWSGTARSNYFEVKDLAAFKTWLTKADHAYDGVLAKYLEGARQKPRLPISGNGIEEHKAPKLHGRQHRRLKDVGEDSV
jgi:hypothetical protein